MKWIPGLVSVTFRELTADRITELCQRNGLEAIEWGGDVHIPAGDTASASEVAEATEKAGLRTVEYGSYYRIGESDPAAIGGVVSCAKKNGTDVIRVWAYVKNYTDCMSEEYMRAVNDARRVCDRFPDMTFCLECHNRSLTEDYRDALRYLRDADRPNLRMFWQPNQFRSHAYNIEACAALLPYIRAVHVFSWESRGKDIICFPLGHHADRWSDYITVLRSAPVSELPMMLEFMHDGKPDSLSDAARTLLDWIS